MRLKCIVRCNYCIFEIYTYEVGNVWQTNPRDKLSPSLFRFMMGKKSIWLQLKKKIRMKISKPLSIHKKLTRHISSALRPCNFWIKQFLIRRMI